MRFRSLGPRITTLALLSVVAAAAGALPGCRDKAPRDRTRASGYVEATEVHVAPEVGGRVLDLGIVEGEPIAKGAVVARLDTQDTELAMRRATAERRQADAQRRLLQAGARPEEIRQAEAQRAAATADLDSSRAELASAERDVTRFEALLASNSGSQKQRDDAVTRRDVARERVRGGEERVQSAAEALARLRAGARHQEIEAASARVAAADAVIAALQKNLDDSTVRAPSGGTVSQKLVDEGELVAPRTPIAVITDLEHPWANLYVGEQDVPRIKLGQSATLFTDAGGPGVSGTVTFISPKAEFTPRNVQTAEERSKLVYRIKVSLDNRNGVFKAGMPVEADIPLTPQPKE